MKILITGVNGFIANNLAKYLQKKDCEVYGTSSKELKNSQNFEKLLDSLKSNSKSLTYYDLIKR